MDQSTNRTNEKPLIECDKNTPNSLPCLSNDFPSCLSNPSVHKFMIRYSGIIFPSGALVIVVLVLILLRGRIRTSGKQSPSHLLMQLI